MCLMLSHEQKEKYSLVWGNRQLTKQVNVWELWRKTNQRRGRGSAVGGGVAILCRVVREGLLEEVTEDQKEAAGVGAG